MPIHRAAKAVTMHVRRLARSVEWPDLTRHVEKALTSQLLYVDGLGSTYWYVCLWRAASPSQAKLDDADDV
jgi:hypothetical protein